MNVDGVRAFLAEHDYDVRISRNGRWIDQKCTFDVLCFVAGQIVSFVEQNRTGEFTNRDIWKSETAVEAVQQDFVKPDPLTEPAHDEYNKFYRQPMKMLAAAGVLSERRCGKSIVFSIRERQLLDFIALRDPNALQFLMLYIEKVLRDSGLWGAFEQFFAVQSAEALESLKRQFAEFEFSYTPIKKKDEPNRIFSKVLNPLAFYRRSKGIVRGRLSKRVITKSELVYNRPNWRDERAGKDKNIARRAYVPDQKLDATAERLIRRSMREVKRMNELVRGGASEVLDWGAAGHRASQAHHIFPRSQVPSIAATVENIIMLTASQHFDSAHPDGESSIIDIAYQGTCIRGKLDTIEQFRQDERPEVASFYSFERFADVLDSGLSTDYFGEMPIKDRESLLAGIELFYPEDPVS